MERPKPISQTTQNEGQCVTKPATEVSLKLTEKIRKPKENCSSSCITENCGRRSDGCLCVTRLAHSRVVSQGHGYVHRQTSNTSTTTEQINITDSTGRNPPPGQDPETSRVSIIRATIERYSISATAKDVIIASWREGTKKQYSTYLDKWKRFCAKRNINWLNATVEPGLFPSGSLHHFSQRRSCITYT